MPEKPGQTWFVRKDGKIRGPFSDEQLLSMKDRGRLTKEHELSQDRASWRIASETHLYQVKPPSTQNDVYEFQNDPYAQSAETPAELSGSVAPQSSQKEVAWFYSKDGKSQEGPVATEILQGMLSNGQLSAETVVWRDGLDAWFPFAQVPELGGVATGTSGGVITPRDPVQSTVLIYITLGIYGAIWTCKTSAEMRAAGAKIPPLWYALVIFLAPVYHWRRCLAIETLTQRRVTWPVAFFLVWFPLVPFWIQKALNEVGVHPLPKSN
ncbi:MAG: GYF domain-containing protein [Planctomycetota bacterium]|nr:GYF domain-containing protein [Planctomycetota bacterium]